MSVLYGGTDLAKNVFAVRGVNQSDAAELRQPKVARARPHVLVVSLAPYVIGMEACSGCLWPCRAEAELDHSSLKGLARHQAWGSESRRPQECWVMSTRSLVNSALARAGDGKAPHHPKFDGLQRAAIHLASARSRRESPDVAPPIQQLAE